MVQLIEYSLQSYPFKREEKIDSFTQKIQNNQALQLNRGFMKRPTSGEQIKH